MDTWLRSSPFLAVGIYLSGDSRACRSQPNLTPTWVQTQLARGWKLLPITMGPQASCNPRFPRYGTDHRINSDPGAGHYGKARAQARAEAVKTANAATALGIAKGSTLWYDLEAFDIGKSRCRESALWFLSAYTNKIRALGFVSGVYSSAGSGIKMLDDARVNRPGTFALPDRIWIARWDGLANTSTTYIRSDGWVPGGRMKQYQGGHDETWGGVRINIDRNWLDLGKGAYAAPESHCDGVRVNFQRYPLLGDGTNRPRKVRALQCLLTEKRVYAGKLTGAWDAPTVAAANKWQVAQGHSARTTWNRTDWMSLLAASTSYVVKYGSAGVRVFRLQRTLNAAGASDPVSVTGAFTSETRDALVAWQRKAGLKPTGIATPGVWSDLRAGRG
jgi:hypothetical protein